LIVPIQLNLNFNNTIILKTNILIIVSLKYLKEKELLSTLLLKMLIQIRKILILKIIIILNIFY